MGSLTAMGIMNVVELVESGFTHGRGKYRPPIDQRSCLYRPWNYLPELLVLRGRVWYCIRCAEKLVLLSASSLSTRLTRSSMNPSPMRAPASGPSTVGDGARDSILRHLRVFWVNLATKAVGAASSSVDACTQIEYIRLINDIARPF
jgi:hypothetical protein